MICCVCKKEFPKEKMKGKGKRYCSACFNTKSKYMKGRKVALDGLRAMPLEAKIIKSKNLIRDAVNEFGLNHIYLSYSGGKDSTVLSHIIRQMYPDMLHIFSNTTNEYPETLKHIQWEKKENGMNLVMTRPKDKNGQPFNFKRVVNEYGFPMFTKRISNAIRTYRRAKTPHTRQNSQDYIKRMFRNYDQYKEFNISDKCCDKLKKEPIKKLAKKCNMQCSIIGTLSEESRQREIDWLNYGCNIFYQKSDNQCRPISFWTEKDIYCYIKNFNVRIADLYSMGYERNGCMFCGFGVEYESIGGKNRYEKLAITHPNMYKYLVDNFGELLDKCNIRY